MININISKEFSITPGARYVKDGPHSGELFREQFLEKLFEDPNDNSEITVILDGTAGYGTSFLEEAFGGLARKFGKERCLKRFRFISNEDKLLIEEIIRYLENA